MNSNLLIVIPCCAVAALVVCCLVNDFILYVYRAGYERGREDAAAWWTQAARDVEQMQQEIREEDR